MRTTLDERRARVVLESAWQIEGVLDLLLVSDAMNTEYGSMLRSTLLRMQAINSVTMRAFDDTDDEINEMECIVFGKVQTHEAEEEEATA